ncbi:MAG: lipoyl synthase [Verrucomicrobia bacterium]|nr:lipoyl synthase [Verrucomicrobiota bacterium]
MTATSTTTAVNRRTRLPQWLRLSLPTDRRFAQTGSRLGTLRLHTVCESARCPNRWECWSRGTATFMIAGNRCTRACGFCAVTTAKPLPLDPDEPKRVAEAAKRMALKHVVVTSVARDDLDDGGAEHFARTIRELRTLCGEDLAVEVLTPDFGGQPEPVQTVLAARPDVFNHNIETVRRLTAKVRHRATYERTLAVLKMASEWMENDRRSETAATETATSGCSGGLRPPDFAGDGRRMYVKSGLMVGHGETETEVLETMRDLRAAGCEFGQYLQPTPANLPVVEFVRPEVFVALRRAALEMGFVHVASAPLVRSSYHADEFKRKTGSEL